MAWRPVQFSERHKLREPWPLSLLRRLVLIGILLTVAQLWMPRFFPNAPTPKQILLQIQDRLAGWSKNGTF